MQVTQASSGPPATRASEIVKRISVVLAKIVSHELRIAFQPEMSGQPGWTH